MLKNKVVLITGATKGIGKEIAFKFASMGATIVINYLSTDPKEILDEIEKMGASCFAIKGDVGDYEQSKMIVNTVIEKFGAIDVLVNNAGITKDTLLLRMNEDDFDSVIRTNLKGTFNTIRHTTPIMLKQKSGSIVNISSVVGVAGNAGQVNYSASKAGIIGITKSVAKELASRGITCNAIAPGFIETDMTSILSEKVKLDILNTIPLNRLGKVSEIAEAVVFLATNKYITGEVLQINGGMYM
jgi:3-oxoacyl-[acyl-carrier protein] reductase